MRLSTLASLCQSHEIAASADTGRLADALQDILNGAQRFTHVVPIMEGLGAAWLYTCEPVRGAEAVSGSGTPGAIATELCGPAQAGMRYPPQSRENAEKGFRIRQTKINLKPAAIIETGWI